MLVQLLGRRRIHPARHANRFALGGHRTNAMFGRVGSLTAIVVAAALLAGCGGSSPSSGRTLDALMKRPGPDVAVIAGAADFQPGVIRFPFLVLDNDLRPVDRPAARVWVATGRGRAPFAQTTARLESVGVPGRTAAADGIRIYVAHLSIPRPGRYWLLGETKRARGPSPGSCDPAPP